MKRVFLIVLDSFGVGEAPDAKDFGDKGANTLKSAYESGKLNIPNLISMGLGNIDGVDCIAKADTPTAKFGKCRELSLGKDTTTGHWEIAGIVSNSPMPTYPNGFPKELLEEFEEKTGYGQIRRTNRTGGKSAFDVWFVGISQSISGRIVRRYAAACSIDSHTGCESRYSAAG